jgi:hypothetical protein
MNVPWEAVVALLIYAIGSTIGFIWWMATQTITLQFMEKAITKMSAAIERAEATYATKIELAEKFVVVNKSLDEAWAKLDHITNR